MEELSMALVQMKGLKCRIDDILYVTTYDEHADLRGLHADHKDSNQMFQLREMRRIMEKLADVGGSIEYLFRPVQETSTCTGMKTGNTGRRKDTVTAAEA